LQIVDIPIVVQTSGQSISASPSMKISASCNTVEMNYLHFSVANVHWKHTPSLFKGRIVPVDLQLTELQIVVLLNVSQAIVPLILSMDALLWHPQESLRPQLLHQVQEVVLRQHLKVVLFCSLVRTFGDSSSDLLLDSVCNWQFFNPFSKSLTINTFQTSCTHLISLTSISDLQSLMKCSTTK
jgi:hypothetical protein